MPNQNQLDIKNPATEISPAGKIYRFSDLPKDVQDKLVQMQKTDGDFLRTDEKRIVLVNVIGLFFTLLVFDGFIKGFDLSASNVIQIIIFGVCSIVFIYWIAYFGRALYRTFALPMRNHVYLTRTQIVETKDGAVRFFDLKDVVKIELEKYISKTMSGGWDYILIFEFADNFQIGPVFPRWWKEHYEEADQWLAKSNVWRDEAAEAFQHNDTTFFRAHDVISKAATANIPVIKTNPRFLFVTPRLMFKITFIYFAVVLVIYVFIKLVEI